VVPEQDVVDLAMSIEDAFKVIVSGGIVNPGNIAVAALSQNSNPIIEPQISSMVAKPIQPIEEN
jgi:uncharacterized membrane protein